jgi:prevent-host-death family protein
MSKHSVGEARSRLSALIDRAVKGKEVIITRHGEPVVELKPVAKQPRPMKRADIDWLKANIVGKKMPRKSGVTLIREMREEGSA